MSPKRTIGNAPRPFEDAVAYLASIDEDWAKLIQAVGAYTHVPTPAREPYED